MASDFSNKRVAVLGTGKMGGILLKALLGKKLVLSKATVATVQHEDLDRARAFTKSWRFRGHRQLVLSKALTSFSYA